VLVSVAAALAVAVLAVAGSDEGGASFPGANGRIAYAYGDSAYEDAIWTANADGTSPTKLTTGTSDREPSFSPDGSRIAFERESSVMVMNADGSDVTELVPGSRSFGSRPTTWKSNYQDPEDPSKVIPFVKIENITTTWHEDSHPAFSPDSSQLVVAESYGTQVESIICAVATEHGTQCLEYGSTGSYSNYGFECEACASHIVTVSASTGGPIAQVTAPSSGYEDYEPTFSVTGVIAFTRWAPGSGWSIYAVPAGGGGAAKLTPGPDDYAPDFSPNGSQIVFAREGGLGLIGSGGGAFTPISVPLAAGAWTAYSTSPVFSPDGSKIAFQHYVYFRHGLPSENGIFTIAPNGAGLVKAVDLGNHPSWQPVAASPPPSAPSVAPPAAAPSAAATSHPVKGKVALTKSGTGTIGTIVCGTSTCTAKVVSASLKVGKGKCAAKVSVPGSLAPGRSGKVTVAVKGKCLAALFKAKKGKLVAKLSLTEASSTKTLNFNSTLTPPKATKPKHHHTK
jgi:Tol biopolymer transport system component